MNIKYWLSAGALVAISATAQTLQTTQKGDTTIIMVENPTKYLILPVEENRPVSTGFKVCTLIFVNIIAGILMLCDDKN